jgi:hypothetical protein
VSIRRQDNAKGGVVVTNCNVDPEVWFDYAEGELNPDFKKDLSLHLKDCEQCQVSYAEYRWIRTGVRKSMKADEVKLPSEKSFDQLHDKIMAQVSKTSIGATEESAEVRRIGSISPFWVRRIAVPMAASAALALIVVGSLITTPGFKSSTNSFAKQDNIEEQFIEQTASSNPNALGDSLNSMMTSEDSDEMVLDAAAAKLSRMSDTEARTMLDNMK